MHLRLLERQKELPLVLGWFPAFPCRRCPTYDWHHGILFRSLPKQRVAELIFFAAKDNFADFFCTFSKKKSLLRFLAMNRGKDIEVMVLDISPSMGAYLIEAKQALLLRVQNKLIQMPNKSEIGILLLGSRETENNLSSEEDYLYIREVRSIQQIGPDIFKTFLRIAHGIDAGDWLDAIIVAMDMIINYTGPKKADKRIILISNDSRNIRDVDQIEAVTQELLVRGIQLEYICTPPRTAMVCLNADIIAT